MSIYTIDTLKPLKTAVFSNRDILQVSYHVRRVYKNCTDCIYECATRIYECATVVYMRVQCI